MHTSLNSINNSTASSSHREVEVSGRNKGIKNIDLARVFATPEEAQLLAVITSFDLSRNEIEVLSNLHPLVSLKRLDVSYNLITVITGLPMHLTHLNLAHNKLTNLDVVARLPHLRELNVSANRLVNLAGLTASRAPLAVVHADDNRLTSTLGLEEMTTLQVVSLTNNFIESADELLFLTFATSLQVLSMKNNPLTLLSGYRRIVGRLSHSLLSLDGVPLLRDTDEAEFGTAGVTSSVLQNQIREREPLPQVLQRSQEHAHTRRHEVHPATPDVKLRRAAGRPKNVVDSTHASFNVREETRQLQQPQQFHSLGRSADASDEVSTPIFTTASHYRDVHGQSAMHSAAAAARVTPGRTPVAAPCEGSTSEVCGPFAAAARASRSNHRAPAASQIKDDSHNSYAAQLETSARKAARAQQHQQYAPSPGHTSGRSGGSAGGLHGHSTAASPQSPRTPSAAAATAALHDALVAKEQLESERSQLRAKLKKTETQLSEARRVMSEQLAELAATRAERDASKNSETEMREKLERAQRGSKTQEKHHKEEVITLQTQYERIKAFYEAQLADLRRQLANELVSRSNGRGAGHGSQAGDVDVYLLQQQQQQQQQGRQVGGALGAERGGVTTQAQHLVPSLLSEEYSVLPDTPFATPQGKVPTDALATKLKSWLYSEISSDMGKAEEEALVESLKVSLASDIRSSQEQQQQQQERQQKSTDPMSPSITATALSAPTSGSVPSSRLASAESSSMEGRKLLLEAFVMAASRTSPSPVSVTRAAAAAEAKADDSMSAVSASANSGEGIKNGQHHDDAKEVQ